MGRGRGAAEGSNAAADLDVTPFMNLMIVLVPVLLLSMVFTRTSVLDLKLPGDGGASASTDVTHLELQVASEGFVVADGRGGEIKRIPLRESEFDYLALSEVMRAVKVRLPEHRAITLLFEPQTPYQTIVAVMDRVKSYQTVVVDEVVSVELFPEVSLGDLPAS